MKGIALAKFILIMSIISIFLVLLINYFGGYLKDSVIKTTCPLIGEEYVDGIKIGEGKCVLPAGIFD